MDTLFTVNTYRRFSKINQEIYTTIEFIDAETGKLYKTYISDDNFNSAHWDDLLDMMQSHQNTSFVIRGKFKTKRKNPDIINADTKFRIVANFDKTSTLNGIWDTYYA